MLATAVCARIGAATVAAHQIAFQLFGFLALVLDAIAIAGQVIVGRALGAGDADEAFAAARRMIELSLAAGLVIGGVFLALSDVIPRAFTSDPDVIDQAHELWPLFCVMWPVAAVVFALDGILIGAGDTRYLAAAMVVAFVVFLPIVLPRRDRRRRVGGARRAHARAPGHPGRALRAPALGARRRPGLVARPPAARAARSPGARSPPRSPR